MPKDKATTERAKSGSMDARVAGGRKNPGDLTAEEDDVEREDPAEAAQIANAVVRKLKKERFVRNDDEGGDDSEADTTNDDMDDEEKDTTNRVKEIKMPRLKMAERDELVDNLVTNCDCWKHAGSEAILNEMADEQLIALNVSHERRTRLEEIVANFDEEGSGDEGTGSGGLPKSFKSVKKGGGTPNGGSGLPEGAETGPNTRSGSDIASGQQEEEYPDDDSDRDEDDYESDRQVSQGRTVGNRQFTPEQWLRAAKAPPAIVNAVRNQMRQDAELKEQLIETITTNEFNPYSEKQLNNMSTAQLEPLAQLASSGGRRRTSRQVVNGEVNRLSSFFGAQGSPPVTNRRESKEDDLLIPPTLNWAEANKENRAH